MLGILLITLFVVVVLLHHRNQIIDFVILVWRAYFALSDIPGPPNLPIIGSVHNFKWNNVDFSFQIENYLYEYAFNRPNRGGIVKAWLGPLPVVFLVSARHVKTVLENQTLITKASLYGRLIDWIGTGLLISTNDKWKARRKLITPCFHFEVLRGYQEVFARHGKILVDQLDSKADTGREVDVFPFIKRCALDIICETTMGTHLNSQIGGNTEYVDAVRRLSEIVWNYIRFPVLWFLPVWYLTGLGFEFDRLVRLTTDFTRNVIHDRRKEMIEEGLFDEQSRSDPDTRKKSKLSFIDMLLLAQRSNELSDEDIREEVDTFMFEGQDTTAASTGWTIWFLGQYPEYQKEVQDELDAILGDEIDREPTEKDLKQLHFLERCIRESLRIASAVPILARSLSHDLQLDDVLLPKNLTVVLSPCGTHRDPQNWERPEEFYPDHFLPDKVATRHPFAYIPFSAGPRNCIGQKFAMAEELTILSWVFRRYRVETVEPHPGNRGLTELILKPYDGFRVRLFKRRD